MAKAWRIMCSIIKKGTKVYVEGRIQNREWDGQDGQKVRRTEIVIEDMIILDSKRDSNSNSGNEPQVEESMEVVEEINTDDLPF